MQFSKNQKKEIEKQYKFLTYSVMKKREYGGEGYSKRDIYQRDYARILYSSSFRRLQGKMQILGIQSSAYYRNRLTHSLEVAQIAKSIASLLSAECNVYKNNDIMLIEAAALAHDIGHPAFGHKGEHIIDSFDKGTNDWIRFEGNAQNFKVLRTLEKKEPKIEGLNLTNRCLLAINKYIVKEDYHFNQDIREPIRKKFMYANDYDYLYSIRQQISLVAARTLDAQIIEIADDIAYAVHDLEDALALGLFTIDEFLYMVKEAEQERSTKYYNAYKYLKKFVDNARNYSNKSKTYKTSQEYSQVFRKRLTTTLTNALVNDITLVQVDKEFADEHGVSIGNWELSLDKYKGMQRCLTKLIFTCANRNPLIMNYEARGEKVINTLYNFYSDNVLDKDGKFLPPDYRPRSCYSLKQGTIDYIAGMMDTFAIERFEEITGTKFQNIPII